MKRTVSFVALLTVLLLCGCSLQTGGMPSDFTAILRAGFSRLKEAGKKIFIFTCDNEDEAGYIKRIGADGAYVDDPSVLE